MLSHNPGLITLRKGHTIEAAVVERLSMEPRKGHANLFNNSFPRLMSSERLIKSSERVIMSSERLINSSERVIGSSERLIKSSEQLIMSSERLINSSE